MNGSHEPSTVPTATVYQNETDVVIIFSPVKDDVMSIRGTSISFENNWSDGSARGLSGFKSNKQLDSFLKENNLQKRGTIKLDKYCYSKHGNKDGSTSTCVLKKGHSGNCQYKFNPTHEIPLVKSVE